ncbi:sensor domain-containing diguanylate cyclase [Sporomusa sp.]|uniref:sensor domain-containing diguanylate cyclase n=1 Tax=Sporomusa sp. TaxID=2078658 RepID=UPI002B8054F0|nr:sensor domain-containing diguanylate cyclase [Sporomusa sp.]HWR45595.1 sensor domain-containing diguanylate cyclase [Sporomusa sp.]
MYIDMINTVVNAKPSALITVNATGIISYIHMTGRSQVSLAPLIGKRFLKLLRLVFDMHNCLLICDSVSTCQTSQQQTAISQFKHISSRNLTEYFDCTFAPGPEQSVIIFFQNVTETVLFQEELFSITEQHEALNQDLCVSMAKLDFHLMDLEHAHKKLSALYRITAIVQKTVNEQEVLEEILDGITRELGYINAAIFLLEPNSQELINKAHRGYNDSIRIPLGQGVTGYAALHRELVYIPDITLDSRYIPGTTNGFSEVAIPLIVNDQVIGVLDVETSEEQALKAYDLDLLRSLASQIAITIAHANHVNQACIDASTDGLTSLYNYRHFRIMLQQELKRATRYKWPLCLLMIDIDYFKHYNDINGHLYGDDALKAVAELVRQYCRDTDFVFRYGGEEFMVLLPETNVTQAHIIAERIRKAIAEYPFQNSNNQPGGALTVSIGIAGYPDNADSESELIDAADTALYSAKRSTRNRSCLYSTNN